jgi:hemimethylated DNA binding protein
MPGLLQDLDRTTALQLVLLMMVVPFQIVLTDWMGTPEYQRSDSIRRMVTNAQFYYDQYCMDFSQLRKNLRLWVFRDALSIEDYREAEPPAVSDADPTKDAKTGSGLLGASLEAHSPRHIDMQYRVGQVIKHRRFNYRAVIIGWDERPKAPKGWFAGVVPEDEMADYVNQPFYSVLIDTRDRAPQTTYIPQANIEVLPYTKIIHPSIDDYFENFDSLSSSYQMRPWLKRIYPHDGP